MKARDAFMACRFYCYFADVDSIVAYATPEGKESAGFSQSHGVPRVDDRRVIPGMIDGIRDGLRWNDAPNADGPHKTLSTRCVRWNRLGVCQPIFDVLANQGPKPSRLVIAATHVTAHRIAASLRGGAVSGGQQVDCIPSAMRVAMALDVRDASP